MPKPWARIEINYINHPKFLALTSNAICLWHEGKSYADSHLTDGMIPATALKLFRFHSPATVALLCRSCGVKPNGSPYAPLWEALDVGGVKYLKMHDYLDHNDCRDRVLERMAQADVKRAATVERMKKWRASKKSDAVCDAVTSASPKRISNADVTSPTETETETETEVQERVRTAFARFWELYPRKENRKGAEGVWELMAPGPELVGQICEAVARQKHLDQWQDLQFVPMPKTYLQGARWMDALPPVALPEPERWSWSVCPHTPKCGSAWNCSTRSALEKARAERAAAV